MKTKLHQILLILGLSITLACLLAACQPSLERASKPSADWSRSVELGNYVTGSIGIVVDGPGERVHLVWPANIGEGVYLRYMQLDAQANQVVIQNLDIPGLLRTPRLVSAAENNLHLFWASRSPGVSDWTLWHTTLDANGRIGSSTIHLSLPGSNVGNYTVASDHHGGAVVCWDGGSPGEIYLQHLDQFGEFSGEPIVVTSAGKYPSIWVEPDGNVHLAWQEYVNLVYAQSSLETLSLTNTTVIGDMPQGTGRTVDGPYLGIAGDWVYVFWSVLNQSGLEAGTGSTVYTAFPAAAPVNIEANRLLLSPAEEQPYAAYQGSMNLTQLAPPVTQAWASTDFILSPRVMQGSQSDELAVALAINQEMRLDQHLQIAVTVFRDGQFIGYTMGSKTENISDDPFLFVDEDMQLHLVWREGAAGNRVYYGTTQPEAVVALERLNAGDVIQAIFQGGMEGLIGITFLPIIGFGWLLPGMIVVGLVKIFRDQDVLSEWKYWIPLIIAILIYYTVKLATLPTMSTYVPFSAWLDIPERFGVPLRIIVPALILAIAIFVSDWVRRRKTDSAVVFYLVFVLIDATLTLAIYGVNFLGSY